MLLCLAPIQPAMARPELLFISINLTFNLNLRLAFWGLSQDQEKQVSNQSLCVLCCSRVKWENLGTRSWGDFAPVIGSNTDPEPFIPLGYGNKTLHIPRAVQLNPKTSNTS